MPEGLSLEGEPPRSPVAKVKLPKRNIGRYKAVDFPFKYVPERD